MKPALVLEPVHWQGQLVGHIRKFDGRGLLLDAMCVTLCLRVLEFVLE
jgi:hypothetical protein